MNRAEGNQHLQFTAEIWTTDAKPPLPEKYYRVQVVMNDEFLFLDMKMIWYTEGDLQFSDFRKNDSNWSTLERKVPTHPVPYAWSHKESRTALQTPPNKNPPLILRGQTKSTLTMWTPSARRALHLLISQQWEIYGKCRMRIWILITKKNLTSMERKK